MRNTRKAIRSALILILGSALVAWLLFVTANIADIAAQSGKTSDQLWGPDAETLIYPSRYLIFAAIAVFAIGALIAKKLMIKACNGDKEISRLAKPALRFANSAIIVGLSLAVFAAITVFLGSFTNSNDDVEASIRIFEAYLPIILYTVLIVFVLLSGFVFSRTPISSSSLADSKEEQVVEDSDQHLKESQKNVGVSFSVPIVAVAVALIFGLIVYDLTKTSLEVWIWVIIQTIVSAGIIIGTIYAAKSLKALKVSGKPRAGVAVGAQNLNYILSILFVVVVTLMSLSYGASASDQLRVQHNLSISVYSTNPSDFKGNAEIVEIKGASIYVSGTGLQSGSTGELEISAMEKTLGQEKVDSHGFLNITEPFPADLSQGDIIITVKSFDSEGQEVDLDLAATINSDKTVSFQNGSNSFFESDGVKLGKLTMQWALKDLLPGLLLLLLVLVTIQITITSRNKD